jgi:transketolase
MRKSLVEYAKDIRAESLKMVTTAKASHIGGALSMADVLAVLYGATMKIRPDQPKWSERDRFILSKGHSTVSLYAALALRGFFTREELSTYGKDGSRLMAHVSSQVPGVEFSTGSLGHGLPFACGKALAAKRQGQRWRTFVVLSDGELNEGSNWEAILFAAHHQLDNLTVIIDYNKIQSLGAVDDVIKLEPLTDKLIAFGWAVKEVDGHDLNVIEQALLELPFKQGKPSVLLAHTIKGKGVKFMENQLLWHYKSPNNEQLKLALEKLNDIS